MIAVVLGGAAVGGHTRSAMATVEELARRKEPICVVAGAMGGEALVERAGAPFELIGIRRRDVFDIGPGDRARFEAALDRFGPGLVHAFDVHGLYLSHRWAARRGARAVLTICGGDGEGWPVPVMSPLVVFSPEQRRNVLARYPEMDPRHVSINPARVRLDGERASEAEVEAFREELGIAADERVVLVQSRVSGEKRGMLELALEAARHLRSERVVLLLLGAVGCEDLRRDLISRAEAIAPSSAARIVVSDRRAGEAPRFLRMAEVVVGVGRTALEAMSAGVAAAIVGERGFSGVVDEGAWDRMAEVNFSGRDAASLAPSESGPRALARALDGLLGDGDRRRSVAERGRALAARMDVRRGADRYLDLYSRAEFRPVSPRSAVELERFVIARRLWLGAPARLRALVGRRRRG